MDVDEYFQMSTLGADKSGNTDYLQTIAEAEEILKKSNLEWRIFRPSVIFGEGYSSFSALSSICFFWCSGALIFIEPRLDADRVDDKEIGGSF